jgi:hypothetical protein
MLAAAGSTFKMPPMDYADPEWRANLIRTLDDALATKPRKSASRTETKSR